MSISPDRRRPCRRLRHTLLLSTVGLAASLATLPGTAQAEEEEPTGFGGQLLLGIAGVPDYEGSEDYEPSPLLGARLSYDRYYLETRGAGVRANVSPFQGIEFGPVLTYRSGRSDVENERVDALRDVDGTLEAGVFASFSLDEVLQPGDELAFEVEALTDTGDGHEGTLVSFGPSYSFDAGRRLRLGVSLSATYVDEDYAQTYFGVDADNASRSGLAPYEAGGGIKDVGLTLKATYQISEHWGVIGLAGYTRLVGDAADSPLVEDEGSAGQGLLAAGVFYRF